MIDELRGEDPDAFASIAGAGPGASSDVQVLGSTYQVLELMKLLLAKVVARGLSDGGDPLQTLAKTVPFGDQIRRLESSIVANEAAAKKAGADEAANELVAAGHAQIMGWLTDPLADVLARARIAALPPDGQLDDVDDLEYRLRVVEIMREEIVDAEAPG